MVLCTSLWFLSDFQRRFWSISMDFRSCVLTASLITFCAFREGRRREQVFISDAHAHTIRIVRNDTGLIDTKAVYSTGRDGRRLVVTQTLDVRSRLYQSRILQLKARLILQLQLTVFFRDLNDWHAFAPLQTKTKHFSYHWIWFNDASQIFVQSFGVWISTFEFETFRWHLLTISYLSSTLNWFTQWLFTGIPGKLISDVAGSQCMLQVFPEHINTFWDLPWKHCMNKK